MIICCYFTFNCYNIVFITNVSVSNPQAETVLYCTTNKIRMQLRKYNINNGIKETGFSYYGLSYPY